MKRICPQAMLKYTTAVFQMHSCLPKSGINELSGDIDQSKPNSQPVTMTSDSPLAIAQGVMAIPSRDRGFGCIAVRRGRCELAYTPYLISISQLSFPRYLC